jgi:formylglycine-generating enzyme required for sulfatase activity
LFRKPKPIPSFSDAKWYIFRSGGAGKHNPLSTELHNKNFARRAAYWALFAAILALGGWLFWRRQARLAAELEASGRLAAEKEAFWRELARSAAQQKTEDAAAAEAKTQADAAAEWARKAAQVRAAVKAKRKARKKAGAPAAVGSPTAIAWVTIPGGSFMMGYGADDVWSWAKPAHPVTVKSFELAKSPVTNSQYKACMRAGVCTEAKSAGSSFDGDDQPVVGVTWNQAEAFSEWSGGRLPTEAEWEYAARSAGKPWKYPWGNEEATCARAVIDEGGSGCGRASTWPVCAKPKGNTRQGLCDMAGNVWEWVQDWYQDSYNGAPEDGSARESPPASGRVNRGGSWTTAAEYARSAYRFSFSPGIGYRDLGFRPAR